MKIAKSKDYDLILISNLIDEIQIARDANLQKASRICLQEDDDDKKDIWRLLGKDDGYADCMKKLLQTKERLQIEYQNYLTELKSKRKRRKVY
jgi:hypothetical protein